MDKVKIKKAFGFLIIVIGIGMVGLEFLLSIFNSYGSQLENRIINFRKVRRISTDESMQLVPKLAGYHDTNLMQIDKIYFRIARRKAARATAPTEKKAKKAKTDEKAKTQKGTSGGGGQVNLPAVNPDTGKQGQTPAAVPDSGSGDKDKNTDSGDGSDTKENKDTNEDKTQDSGAENQPDATPSGGSISPALSKELVKLFTSNYSPNKDDLKKFQDIVSGLSSDEYGKLMKQIISKDVSIDKILFYNNDFFQGLSALLPKLNKGQKEIIFEVLSNEHAEFSQESMQNIAKVVEFYKSDNAKKLKHKLGNTLFKSYASLFGNKQDNISAAIKYLVSKELDLQNKMRYLSKPLYKIFSHIITIGFLLACIGFIFTMEISRIFIMFFGIIKILFLLTIPIAAFHGITGLVVLFSIVAIVLTFVSMYIVDLRVPKQKA